MKLKKVLPVVLCSLLLTGCWDKIEIDRKIFISIIGIDLGKDAINDKDIKKVKSNEPFQERISNKKLSITYGFPDISALGPGNTGNTQDKYLSVDAASMEDSVLKVTGKSSRTIHLGQTKLLIINTGILEQPEIFKEILDYLERHPNLNKMMQVVVADGNVENYVKYKPSMEKSIENYLSGLMESSKRNATVQPVTLNDMIVRLDQVGNIIIPKIGIDKEKKDIILSGVAVIKNFKLKGYLTPIEVADLELIKGKVNGGKRVIYKDGHPVDINIEDIERKVKLGGDKNKLQFNIKIRMEGQLREFYKGKEVFSKTELNSLENNFSESITEECNIIVKMLQKEFDADSIGLKQYVEKYKPSLWNEIKNNWDEAYKNADINVNVQVKIRRVGVTK